MSQNIPFEQACREAISMVSAIEEPTYRVAAFQVALMKLTSESPRFLDDKKPASISIGQHRKEGTPKSETKARILQMISDDWLKEPRLSTEVGAELRLRGFHHNAADVRMNLLRLAKAKKLRRIQENGKAYRYVKP